MTFYVNLKYNKYFETLLEKNHSYIISIISELKQFILLTLYFCKILNIRPCNII